MSSPTSPARPACGLSEPLLQASAILTFWQPIRDVRCHSSPETIRAALVGNDRDEHIFALTQSLELYDIYQAKMLDCDRKLEVLIAALSNKGGKPVGKLSKPRIKTKQVNTPTFDVRTRAVRRARRRSD